MQFMECQSCRGIVQTNNAGLCLGCQRGFIGIPQEDAYKEPEPAKSVQNEQKLPAKSVNELLERQKEIEDALEGKTEKVQALPKGSKKKRSPRKK